MLFYTYLQWFLQLLYEVDDNIQLSKKKKWLSGKLTTCLKVNEEVYTSFTSFTPLCKWRSQEIKKKTHKDKEIKTYFPINKGEIYIYTFKKYPK